MVEIMKNGVKKSGNNLTEDSSAPANNEFISFVIISGVQTCMFPRGLSASPEEPWRGSCGVTACVRLFADSCDATRRGGTLQESMRHSLELFWKMREVCSVFMALSVMILSDGLTRTVFVHVCLHLFTLQNQFD